MVKVTLEDHDVPTLQIILESLEIMRDDPNSDDFDYMTYDLIIKDVSAVLQQLEQQGC